MPGAPVIGPKLPHALVICCVNVFEFGPKNPYGTSPLGTLLNAARIFFRKYSVRRKARVDL